MSFIAIQSPFSDRIFNYLQDTYIKKPIEITKKRIKKDIEKDIENKESNLKKDIEKTLSKTVELSAKESKIKESRIKKSEITESKATGSMTTGSMTTGSMTKINSPFKIEFQDEKILIIETKSTKQSKDLFNIILEDDYLLIYIKKIFLLEERLHSLKDLDNFQNKKPDETYRSQTFPGEMKHILKENIVRRNYKLKTSKATLIINLIKAGEKYYFGIHKTDFFLEKQKVPKYIIKKNKILNNKQNIESKKSNKNITTENNRNNEDNDINRFENKNTNEKSSTFSNNKKEKIANNKSSVDNPNVSRAKLKLEELEKRNSFFHDFLKKNKGNSLDIGSSPGGWSLFLSKYSKKVISVDPGNLKVNHINYKNTLSFKTKNKIELNKKNSEEHEKTSIKDHRQFGENQNVISKTIIDNFSLKNSKQRSKLNRYNEINLEPIPKIIHINKTIQDSTEHIKQYSPYKIISCDMNRDPFWVSEELIKLSKFLDSKGLIIFTIKITQKKEKNHFELIKKAKEISKIFTEVEKKHKSKEKQKNTFRIIFMDRLLANKNEVTLLLEKIN